MAPLCVVCACAADVYCHNDVAHLCFGCDHAVHSAHAVARSHRRTPISDCVPQNDRQDEHFSLDEHVAVPQDLLPVGKERLDDIDLSFSDDGWFTVPDSACSTARGAIKSNKAKSFEIDDLFGFDAALDEDVAFALDPSPSDPLTDCMVPDDGPEQARELAQPCARAFKEDFVSEEASDREQTSGEPAPTAELPAAPSTPHAPAISFMYPPVADSAQTFENYIPLSLLPVDTIANGKALTERREKVQRFREKKKNRQFKKLIRYASRKRYAEVRPRIKGRFARKDEIAAAKAAGIPLEC